LLGEIGMLPSGGIKMANAMKAKSMVFCMLCTIRNFPHPAHLYGNGKQFMTRLSERAHLEPLKVILGDTTYLGTSFPGATPPIGVSEVSH
jgi:hypothetical protein